MNSLGKNVAVGIVIGVAGYHIPLIHHTVLLQKYKKYFAMHNSFKRVWETESLSAIAVEVVKDLKITDDVSLKLKPFLASGYGIFHAGTLFYKYGAIVGIPIHFLYSDVNEIDKTLVAVNRKEVDWSSEDGQRLLQAMVLSKDAKKYAIAQEFLRIQYHDAIVNAAGTALSLTTTWFLYCAAKSKLNLQKKAGFIQAFMYTFIGLLGTGLYIAQKDIFNIYLDNKVDETMAKLGPSYIKGGKEYYEQMLNQNIALRNLSGDLGKHMFTSSGNRNVFIRQTMKPYTQRKGFFESLLREEESKQLENNANV